MNSILAEIYSTIIPSAPYIIAAYALLWAVFVIWVFIVFRKQEKISQKIELVEDLLHEKTSDNG